LSFQGMYPGERGSGETKTRVIGRNYVANPPHLPPIHRMVREPKPSLDAISLQLSMCLCGGSLTPVSPLSGCFPNLKSVVETAADTRKAAPAGGLRWNEN